MPLPGLIQVNQTGRIFINRAPVQQPAIIHKVCRLLQTANKRRLENAPYSEGKLPDNAPW